MLCIDLSIKTLKSEMEKKGLRMNMGNTKIMVSCINLDMLKNTGNSVTFRTPCALTLRKMTGERQNLDGKQ